MGRFIIDRAGLDAVTQDASLRLIRPAQRHVLNAVKLRAPVNTGFLRATHEATPPQREGTRMVGKVVARADYAVAVHEGSKPHVIRPRRAKALSWKGAGGRVFAKIVHHPGSKPRPWLVNALRAEAPRFGFTVTTGR